MNAVVSPSQPQVLEYVRDVLRRRKLVLGVFGGGAVLTLLIGLLTPPVYQSTATILIEQQEIPQDFVRSTITSFADQRIQMISQRVMTSQNLAGVIERNDLYAKQRKRKPREIVIEQMRDDVRLKMISADVIDPRSGSPVRATIAFTLSYRNPSSELAYKVASELTSLYLNENLTARAKQTQQALAFLEDEGERLQAEITALDGKIAEFKQRNQAQLPQLAQVNQSGVERTELEIRDAANRIASLEQQELLLRAQLAQISPTAPVFSDTGQRVLSPEDRLKAVKSQLAGLRARYGAQHPDVLSAELQVRSLEQGVQVDADENELVRQLDDARTKLAAARARYSAEHPDVRVLENLVASLEQAMRDSALAPRMRSPAVRPDNPVYLQVKAQLDTLQIEKAQLDQERRYLRSRLDDFERRVAQSPEVERQYIALTRDYESAYRKYQEVRAKQLEAQASMNLETERKGERFTLIEPPLPSEAPVSPRRGLIFGVGLVLSLLAGLGAAVAAGLVDPRIRGAADLTRLLEVPPLAQLPRMVTADDRQRLARRLRWSLSGAALSIVTVAVLVHLLWRPLDLIWLQILRRLGA